MGKKIFFCLFLLGTILFFDQEKTYAGCGSGSSSVLDNDNNGLNSSDNDYSGSWKHEYSTNSYRGDHRYAAPTSSGYNLYWWYFGSCSMTGTSKVYLWNTKFNATNVTYAATNSSGLQITSKSINQRNAPGGWSSLLSFSKPISTIRLSHSYNNDGGAGADGIQLNYN